MSPKVASDRIAEMLVQARAHVAGMVGDDLAAGILEAAQESLTTSVTALQRARASEDTTASARALHRIRGILLNMGLDELAGAAAVLERRTAELATPGWQAEAEMLERTLTALCVP